MREFITKPIVFIGMMGSGKSTIGKRLARKLNLQFYDSDKVIEEREGLSIVDKEYDIVKEILGYGTVILSTGGSTFLNDELRGIIKEKAISIWLYADIDILYSRVIRRNTRPELNSYAGDKKEILQKLMDERYPIYSQADITVESKDFDVHYIVDTVMARLRKYVTPSP